MTHLNEEKYVCPFCGYASSTLNSTENHILKMHPEPVEEELGSEDAGKQDNSKLNNIKTESQKIKDKSRDHFTSKSSPICIANCKSFKNVDMNCTVVFNKCIDLHAKEVKVSEKNNTQHFSKFDNITSVKEEVQIFDENLTVKERHTEVDYDVDDYITTCKEEIPVKFECNDNDENITLVQEEFDDDSSYTEGCKENQHGDSTSDVFDNKQKLYNLFDLVRTESSVNEFNQTINQEAKSPSSYSDNSYSFTEHEENIEVKSENFNSNDDEKIKPRYLRFARESHKKRRFEVIKETNSGTSTIIFKSLECPYSSLSKYQIIQHCRTHENNKTYNCMDCNFTAKCLFLLKLHKKSHTENLMCCSACPFVTESISTLRKHIFVQHRKLRSWYVSSKRGKKLVKFKDRECNMRSYITINSNKYQEHIKIRLRNKRKTEASSNSRTFARATKISERVKEPNNIHDIQMSKMKTRRIHVKKKFFKCNKCTFFTYSMGGLTNHKKIHLKPKSIEFDEFLETSKDILEKGEVDYSSQSDFNCNNCSFTTSLKIDFLKHKQVHMPLTEGLFKCTECPFSAAKYKVLLSHLSIHAYKCFYTCVHCNFSSNNKATLKSHKEIHRKPRPTKTNIRQFRGIKMTVKPKNGQVFKCFKCDYSCATEHLLNQHALTHFENKLLKCAHCDYKTNFKGNLVKHVLIHSDEYLINSFTEHEENIKVKSENSNPDDDEKIKPRSLRFTRESDKKSRFEVIKETNSGISNIIFKSLECPYSSLSKYQIIQHCGTHESNKTYKCRDCNFTAKCLFLLKKHKKSHIGNISRCSASPFVTKSISPLRRHIFVQHRIDRSKYKEHIKSHFRNKIKTEAKKSSRTFAKATKISESLRELNNKHASQISQKEIRILVKKIFVCDKCTFFTYSMEKLTNHKKSHVKPKSTEFDTFLETSDDILEKGEIDYSSQSDFNCNNCSFTTSLKIDFLKHKQVHMPLTEGLFKCTECPFSAAKYKVLLSHLSIHAYKCFYTCVHCNFSSNNKATLKSHKEIHRKPRPTKTNIRQFRGIKMTVKPKNGQVFKCFKCDYSCATEHLLNQHALTHFENKLLKCAHCDYKTNFKGNLVKHVLIHADEYAINSFKEHDENIEVKSENFNPNNDENIKPRLTITPESGNRFSYDKRSHYKVIKETKSGTSALIFKSLECPYSCHSKYNIIRHCRTHEKNKTYKCMDCNFTAKCLFLLKRHRKCHKGKFKCFRCDYSFATEHLLNQHALSHFENKLLKCAHCNYKTNFKGNLVKHVLIHADEYTMNSFKEHEENIEVKSDNFNSNDDEKIKPRLTITPESENSFSCDKRRRFEVIKETSSGTSTAIFKSLECPYSCHSKQKIIKHCHTHDKNKTYNCMDCNFTAKCLFLLKRHKKSHRENLMRCSACPFTTESLSTLKKHTFVQHSKLRSSYVSSKPKKKLKFKDLECNMCSFKTIDRNKYLEHIKIHLRNERQAEASSNSRTFARAIKISERLKEPNNIHAIQMSKMKTRRIHVKKKIFKCNKCTFFTYSMGGLTNHKKIHLKPKSIKFDEFLETSKDILEKREVDYSSQSDFNCSNCSFTTTLKVEFLKHKQVHMPLTEGLFKCTECPFSAAKYKVLLSHLSIHAYKCFYTCVHCNFSTNNKAILKSHKEFHRKPRPLKTNIRHFRGIKITVKPKNGQVFKCFKCDYSCATEHLLNQHALTHFENKLLKCAHCDYKTNFKGNLVKHVLIHSDEYLINSFTEHEENIEVKSENSNPDDDEKIKPRSLRFTRESDKKSRFEVIKETNSGTSNIIFKSLECPYSSLSKYQIIQHCGTHESNKTYRCRDCNFTAKCLFLLKKHKKSHTGNISCCSASPFVTKSISPLRRRIFVHHRIDRSKYKEHIKSHFRNKIKTEAKKSSRTFAKATKISESLRELNNKHASQISQKEIRILVKKIFVCDKCTFFTYSMEKLTNHKKSHVKPKSTEFDTFLETSDDILEKGEIDYSSQSDFNCNNCSFTTSLKIDFLKHKQVHMPLTEGLFKCTECPFSAAKYKVLLSHLSIHAYKCFYTCVHCNFSSNNKATLKSHKEIHRKPRPTKTNIRQFRGIKMTVKPKNGQVFKCFKCDYSCATEHLLNQHALTHFENKLLKCAHCDYETNFKGNLVKHVLIHADEYAINSFKEHDENIEVKSENFNPNDDENIKPRLTITPESGNRFSCDKKSRYKVIKETKSGTSALIFKSLECPYSCHCKYNIIRHCRTHEKNKTYKCMDCNFTAKCLFLLKRHRKCHKGKFKCFRCDYSFATEHLLNQHALSHFENKLLKCAHCNYKTNFKGNLVKHVLIHVDEYT